MLDYRVIGPPRVAVAVKTNQRYSDVISFVNVRRTVRFDLLKTCLIALRGKKRLRVRDTLPIIFIEMHCL